MKGSIVAEELLWSNEEVPVSPPPDYKADVYSGWVLTMVYKPAAEGVRYGHRYYFYTPDFELIHCNGELLRIFELGHDQYHRLSNVT